MKSPKIDANGDLVLSSGEIVVLDGDEELAQAVRVLYKTDINEWFLDPEFGLDKEPLHAKQFDEVEASDAIIEATNQEERISSVESINFTKVGRQLNIDLELIKDNGEPLTVAEVI